MSIPTIDWVNNSVKIINQKILPSKLEFIYCRDIKALYKAIKTLQVRGAPALGIAAALGIVLTTRHSKTKDRARFKKQLDKAIRYLSTARPTAVNLFSALKRMEAIVRENSYASVVKLKKLLFKEAMAIIKEDKLVCRKMAKFGARLIKDNDRILTICNAGALATADYGTALGVIYRAKEEGKSIKVFSCETRPLLQGARLTTWELLKENIDTTLICDNMAASLMANKKIDKIFVGADRIAANGDTANKIGTYNLAVLAKYHKIPFYVVAPASTFDLGIQSGNQIPIENRSGREITHIFGRSIAPSGIKTYNPAFDVTPHKLITAIITERGIIESPFKENIKEILVRNAI
ncbi:MAG: S-methyl-5-thioribose-1-phosphate isomerase [Candidatus Omnitrophota bacterium]|nr:S-methyl-5-thioribose-1-phosphate isomerase [Candidatus Omnitrophota bacterium]